MKLSKLDRELRRAWQLNEHLEAHPAHEVEPVRTRNRTDEGLKTTSKRAAKRAERRLARAVIQDALCPQRTHDEEQDYLAEVRHNKQVAMYPVLRRRQVLRDMSPEERGNAAVTPDERHLLWQEAFDIAATHKTAK